jgi:hypothetical protein
MAQTSAAAVFLNGDLRRIRRLPRFRRSRGFSAAARAAAWLQSRLGFRREQTSGFEFESALTLKSVFFEWLV